MVMKKILLSLIFFVSFSWSYEVTQISSDLYYIIWPEYNNQQGCLKTVSIDNVQAGDTNGRILYSNSKIIKETGSYQITYYNTSSQPVDVCTNYTPTPTCTATQELINNVCVEKCQFGYSRVNGTCTPDVQCPSTMKYFANEVDWGFDVKICLPNRDLTPEECASQGGAYANPTASLDARFNAVLTHGEMVTVMGKGCYDLNYINKLSSEKTVGVALSFGTAKIDKAFLAQVGNSIYAGGKSIKDFVMGFFKTNPVASETGLTVYRPDFIDVKIQDDGTYAVMDYKLRTDIMNDLNGKPTVDLDVPNPTKIYGIETPDIIPDNVYLGGDIHTFEANIIGTKSFLDDVKPFSIDDTRPVDSISKFNIDLKNSLYGTEKSSFPATSTLLEKTTKPTGEVVTKTATKINYPDGSYTNVTTLATKLADASKVYEVTTTTPIITNSGIKVFEGKAVITENSSGQITNSVVSPSVVKFVDDNGYVASTPNTSTNSAPKTFTETGTINLSNIQSSLNKINQQLADIKTAVNTAPTNINEFNTAIGNFKSGMTNWSLGLDNAVSFINGMKDNFTNLETQLSDALATFEDKPELTLPSGSCPFQASWYGDTFTVDPCMFISPYRPILSAFLTFFMSWSVFWFCLKFFFKVG